MKILAKNMEIIGEGINANKLLQKLQLPVKEELKGQCRETK